MEMRDVENAGRRRLSRQRSVIERKIRQQVATVTFPFAWPLQLHRG